MPDDVILRMSGVDKSFGAVHVLKQVNFEARNGEVTALVGDNGAGKTTLVKCMGGSYPYDAGDYEFDGHPVTVHTPRDAAALGIEIVYQDLALCDNLDVVQNMFLGRERVRGIVLDEGAMEVSAKDVLNSLSVRTLASVRQRVSSLSGGQRQTVAIAKAVLWNSKLVAATVKRSDVTQTQVVELITSGRSGDIGLAGNGQATGAVA